MNLKQNNLNTSYIRQINKLNDNLQELILENKHQLNAMNQHNIVSMTDVNGVITYVNDNFCVSSGYSRKELIGKTHALIKSGHYNKQFYKNLWKTINQGKVWQGIICNLKKDKSEYWVDTSIIPYLDNKNKPYQFISIKTDITRSYQNEQRLVLSQKFSGIGTWDWNIRTGHIFWSEGISSLFGYKQHKSNVSYDDFLNSIHEDDRQAVIDAVNECVENGKAYNIEHRVVWPDGQVMWVQEKGGVVRNDDNVALNMIGVVMDINKKKKDELSLINAQKEAEKANKAKSIFLSNMSHELRTPLNAILGFSQLLAMDQNNALVGYQQENVKEILTSGKHLLSLVNEILDLAKVEAGQVDIYIEKVNLYEVLSESLQMISPMIKKKNIEIRYRNSSQDITPEQMSKKNILLLADKIRLKQVIVNLLTNAVKYNNENGIISISYKTTEKQTLRLGITDTGIGISIEDQNDLFKSFNRLSNDNSQVEGYGIGLVISKNIIELIGGTIDFQSTQGSGSTFWIEIPMVQQK
ncbi:MAG: PAS domain-containing protein [Gammaproteobacteria bacterium]|nr:PAS domain-containing protein [Gammaproteobacteria bacterium]